MSLNCQQRTHTRFLQQERPVVCSPGRPISARIDDWALSMTGWHEYQERAAAFFRGLSLTATVDHKVDGVRACHKIDVYVEGKFHGITLKWIVECKNWKTNIPKEKVMALNAIIQDIGADRGFLLSEVGFQSGAIRAARQTNITLSSIDDLSAAAETERADLAIGRLSSRAIKAWDRYLHIKKTKYRELKPSHQIGFLLYLNTLGFSEAIKRNFPATWEPPDGRYVANTMDEFVDMADQMLTEAENYIASLGD